MMRNVLPSVLISAFALSLGGCAHYHLVAVGSDGAGAGGDKDVLVKAGERMSAKVDCKGYGLYDVKVSYEIGQVALMALTLGIANPSAKLSWHCGAPPPTNSMRAEDGPPQTATATGPLWGLKIATPDANCRDGYISESFDVRSSFGQRLISLLTLGIAVPRTVEWRCTPRRKAGPSVIHVPGHGN